MLLFCIILFLQWSNEAQKRKFNPGSPITNVADEISNKKARLETDNIQLISLQSNPEEMTEILYDKKQSKLNVKNDDNSSFERDQSNFDDALTNHNEKMKYDFVEELEYSKPIEISDIIDNKINRTFLLYLRKNNKMY